MMTKDNSSAARAAPLTVEHTPGPWEMIPQNGGAIIIAHPFETGKQMNPRGLRIVCDVLLRGNSLAMDEANARLIAAAPTMYDLLKAGLDFWNDEDGDNLSEWREKVRAALSKAEGR